MISSFFVLSALLHQEPVRKVDGYVTVSTSPSEHRKLLKGFKPGMELTELAKRKSDSALLFPLGKRSVILIDRAIEPIQRYEDLSLVAKTITDLPKDRSSVRLGDLSPSQRGAFLRKLDRFQPDALISDDVRVGLYMETVVTPDFPGSKNPLQPISIDRGGFAARQEASSGEPFKQRPFPSGSDSSDSTSDASAVRFSVELGFVTRDYAPEVLEEVGKLVKLLSSEAKSKADKDMAESLKRFGYKGLTAEASGFDKLPQDLQKAILESLATNPEYLSKKPDELRLLLREQGTLSVKSYLVMFVSRDQSGGIGNARSGIGLAVYVLPNGY